MSLYKLEPEVAEVLFERLNDEYTAFYFYRNAANWCKNMGFTGGAKYFSGEAASEIEHAKSIEKYLTDWNIMPELKPIEKPESFSGLQDIIEKAYELEYDLCDEYKKAATLFMQNNLNTFTFIQEYIKIQNDSVAEYSDLLNQLALINPMNKFELFYFDKKVLAKL